MEPLVHVIKRNRDRTLDEEVDYVIDRLINDPFSILPQEFFSNILRKKRVRSSNLTKDDFQNCRWLVDLNSEEIKDPASQKAKKFHRRFRMPYPLFLEFVEECRENNIFNSKYNGKIPLELKILCCLKMLARDCTGDDINDFVGIGESTVYQIFSTFIRNIASKFKDKYIRLPTEEDAERNSRVYELLGFPGCIGSIDCTHISWQCPKNKKVLCTGKEGYSTLVFEVD